MKAIHRKRLLNVAKALRESPTPRRDFSMGSYTAPCGTPACALGHYAMRRDLQKTFRLARLLPDHNKLWLALPNGTTIDYFKAPVLEHFGIDRDEAGDLFSTCGCGGARTAAQAARFIERFVARKDREAKP